MLMLLKHVIHAMLAMLAKQQMHVMHVTLHVAQLTQWISGA